ncbi:hypothetical protein HBB16_07470 [Pseudonocardia sp. MCCB 268]|nr:hypothetical protein [Pseudonocardia cytotoxica]
MTMTDRYCGTTVETATAASGAVAAAELVSRDARRATDPHVVCGGRASYTPYVGSSIVNRTLHRGHRRRRRLRHQ